MLNSHMQMSMFEPWAVGHMLCVCVCDPWFVNHALCVCLPRVCVCVCVCHGLLATCYMCV
jgi:hypothetical protein